ncbi:hypothetical protein K438DRAFT_1971675 [Mycena galopus ATCC 62051]|nr:hypothetical protein K438DRAFT_1971675 [Mycena galopus ATCC 62051]
MAFVAYNNPVFLEYAIQVWSTAASYTLSQSDVNVGTVPFKDFAIASTCDSVTMAGGTFERKNPLAPTINVLATGGFFVLSALLAEATGEQEYMDAAKASLNFISNHLLNSQKVVQDAISARANDSCAASTKTIQEAYNSGLVIEGLAILYSVTSDASIFDMIGEMVRAVFKYSGWQGSNGIIRNGATKSGDPVLPRALATVIARSATTAALKSSIEAYLSVQFNAVVDLATTPGSNIYASSWVGPPSSLFSAGHQTSAIQALIRVVNLQNETTMSTSPSNAAPSSQAELSPTPSPRKMSSIGPIVGGSLGGLILLIGVVTGVVLLRRRQRQRRLRRSHISVFRTREVPPAISPFNVQPGKPLAVAPPPPRKVGALSQAQTLDQEIESTGRGNGITPIASQLPTNELVAILYHRMHQLESGRPPSYPQTEIRD